MGETRRDRNKAELHHHPLLFTEDLSSPSDTTTHCSACGKKVLGWSYSCGECRFYLHKKCAEMPSEIHHFAHRDHPLLLLLPPSQHQKKEVDTSICPFKVKGFIYHCSSCEFYLDFNYALFLHYTSDGKFIETAHVGHEHPLISIKPTTPLECHGCLGLIEIDDASYCCFECLIAFHQKCLQLPTSTDHPCHRRHPLLLVFNSSDEDFPECNLCQRSIRSGFFYRCFPCEFHIHLGCAWPSPIVEDKSHHDHPFTLLLKPNDPFHCNACGNQGNYVSYICSTCNIQVHKDCVSLPRHIRLTLHPHPVSHCFFLRIDHHDSKTWDCRICYETVNIEHGSYYCSRPGCDFVIHVKCSIEKKKLYGVVEVENPDEFEESEPLYEPMSCFIRIIKEIKVGDDIITGEIEHVNHEHNLIFSDEIKDNRYCNGCVLPILSSFYYCSCCDFFLHKTCAELPKRIRSWFVMKPCDLQKDGIFRCFSCNYHYNGFFYKVLGFSKKYLTQLCLTCALMPHSFTYHADEPHFLFFVEEYEGNCNACGKDLSRGGGFRCKDCKFAMDWRCAILPRTAWHKCDQHSLTLAYQDLDDYPLRHYCDICEERRDSHIWFYHCETCDNAVHIKCILGEDPFIKAGSKYTDKNHPHLLTFVNKIYYYPKCVICGSPCQDLSLECVEHGCKYIVHGSCFIPNFPLGFPPSDSDSDSGSE